MEQTSPKTCKVNNKCGACQNIEVPYCAQLKQKTAEIQELFSEVEGAPCVLPILGMKHPYGYRNKVTSPFAPGKKLPANQKENQRPKATKGAGSAKAKQKAKKNKRSLPYKVLSGMYAAHSHKIVNTDSCVIEHEHGKAVVRAIRTLMGKYGVEPYNEDTNTGFMRHVVVRIAQNTNEVLVTLVTNKNEFASSKQFCRQLVKLCPFITTIVQNINTRNTNVILGQKERVLYGPGFILDTLCSLSFRISSTSFYQVNCAQTEVLYNTAVGFALCGSGAKHGHTNNNCAESTATHEQATFASTNAMANPVVIDAYCGTGTIGLVAAKLGASRVIGVDCVASAIKDARENAKHNGIENATFATCDAGEFMLALAGHESTQQAQKAAIRALERGAINPNETVLMLDPPRAGSSPKFLQAALSFKPARIVYISCNPKTQVRDVKVLASAGYKIEAIQPVDMFPHTNHVENVVLMVKVRDK